MKDKRSCTTGRSIALSVPTSLVKRKCTVFSFASFYTWKPSSARGDHRSLPWAVVWNEIRERIFGHSAAVDESSHSHNTFIMQVVHFPEYYKVIIMCWTCACVGKTLATTIWNSRKKWTHSEITGPTPSSAGSGSTLLWSPPLI